MKREDGEASCDDEAEEDRRQDMRRRQKDIEESLKQKKLQELEEAERKEAESESKRKLERMRAKFMTMTNKVRTPPECIENDVVCA